MYTYMPAAELVCICTFISYTNVCNVCFYMGQGCPVFRRLESWIDVVFWSELLYTYRTQLVTTANDDHEKQLTTY